MGQPPATARPYLVDAYTAAFDASVVACERADDARHRVILDQTYFYPESGGQLPDRGSIAGIGVVDVQEDESGRVLHYVSAEIAAGPVACSIDWDRRFDHMQQHTGQHVLSRAFIDVAGLQTVSFHMGEESCTIDLDGGELTDAIVDRAETLANNIVLENRPVDVRTMARGELSDEALRRKLPDDVDEVRLVDVGGFDVCGCCGTHVRATGELGVVKVLKFERAKGLYRVSFKVGRRAVDDYRLKHNVVRQLANRFTTSVEEIADKVEKLQAEGQQSRKSLKRISQRLAELEAERLLAGAREHGGRRFVVGVFAEEDADFVRALGGVLKGSAGTVSLLAACDGTVICQAAEGTGIDFAEAVIERARRIGGSGGGKGGFATVRLPEDGDAGAFIEDVFNTLKDS